MAGKLFDGIVRYDDTFYDMVNEETMQERDMVAMGQMLLRGM
jgi:hypothetical protein